MTIGDSPLETLSEFGRYNGDCVPAAVQMGAHFLAPYTYPLTLAALDARTQETIAANIGVGPRGEMTPSQLEWMLGEWHFRYSRPYPYTGITIPVGFLQTILAGALSRKKPVLLGFTNGQALTGDEVNLHGHEIVVLHPPNWTLGYGCGDGDSSAAVMGHLSYYPLAVLEAAQPDSAYVLEEVPGMIMQLDETGGKFVQRAGLPPDSVWTCTEPGHAFDVQHGTLDYYRLVAPIAGLGLPEENLRPVSGGEYEQNFDLYTIHWSPARGGYLVPRAGSGPVYLHAGPASLADDGQSLHVAIPYTMSGQR